MRDKIVAEKEEQIKELQQKLRESELSYREKTKELEKALKEAESANKAKSRFLAQTSHEIRTPLNIIIGMTELAKDEIDHKDRVLDYLMKIDGSSKILLNIINDILDMSAIEGGEITIEAEKFDFKSLITNLSIMHYQQSQKKNIHFDVHLSGISEDFLVGDELKLNQILMNLLSNAFKFTASGGHVDLEVIQASTSRERVHMRFVVRDTGCGMSEDMLGRLFQPFEQENDLTAQKFGGSGLGMSITKNLIEMMGGTIHVKSKLGEGTTFTIDIPFGRTERGVREKVASSFAKYRAIVVADSEENCKERGAVLEDMGLSYDIATDGEVALDMIGEAEEEGKPYKLCIIDWRISSMSGTELIQQIRDIFGNDMVIIGASYQFSDEIAQGKDAGANYMVAKPVFRSTLFDALINLSQGKIDQYERESQEVYDFTGKRILIAEDVALNMEVVVKLLKKVGIEASCVENGLEAVQLFAQKPEHYFDCIFLDINMPVMDGYEASRQIRRSERAYGNEVPIYAMTANAFTKDVSEALDAGMNGHIAKPIETDVLYNTLKKLFCS